MTRFDLLLRELRQTCADVHPRDAWPLITGAVGRDSRCWVTAMPEVLGWPVPASFAGTPGAAVLHAVRLRAWKTLYPAEAGLSERGAA